VPALRGRQLTGPDQFWRVYIHNRRSVAKARSLQWDMEIYA